MTYYQTAMFTLGWIFLTIMVMRIPPIAFDARIFRRVFKQANWPHPTWFTFSRVVVPGLLGGPFMLWMDPLNFFRRSAAPEIWDAAQQLMAMYAPDEEEEEEPPAPEPGPKDITLLTNRQETP